MLETYLFVYLFCLRNSIKWKPTYCFFLACHTTWLWIWRNCFCLFPLCNDFIYTWLPKCRPFFFFKFVCKFKHILSTVVSVTHNIPQQFWILNIHVASVCVCEVLKLTRISYNNENQTTYILFRNYDSFFHFYLNCFLIL